MTESEKLMAAFVKMLSGAKPAKKAGRKGKTKTAKAPTDDAAKLAAASANEAKVIEVFTALGYEDVKPRINVLVAKEWLKQGRIPAKGQKAVYIKDGGYPLFHVEQTVDLAAVSVVAEAAEATQALH